MVMKAKKEDKSRMKGKRREQDKDKSEIVHEFN
jgi:hypothetical protein